jgi:DNA-binding transcriptional LysR family regulator
MELYQITQFLAFAETGNISKAAQNVNTSQPALSRTMKHLEEELGVPLFVRTKNTIALNEYGKLAVQLTDESANATYYAVCARENYGELRGFFDGIK